MKKFPSVDLPTVQALMSGVEDTQLAFDVPHTEKSGSSDFSPLWCGTNKSGCKEISAFQLTREPLI